MNDYSILVVDDETLAREYIVNLFDWDRFGIKEIYQADNCLTAIEIVNTCHPDIIILDILMPEMSGMEFLTHIEANNQDVEIIFLSGFSDFENARKMIASKKVVDYLLKPISKDNAAEVIMKAIDKIDKKNEQQNINGLFYERHQGNQETHDPIVHFWISIEPG